MEFDDFLSAELREIADKNLLRSLRVLDSPQQPTVSIAGGTLRNFSSNDYLGLAAHPDLIRALAAGEGFGSGASRLVCGTMAAHEELEAALASFKRTEAALSFSSGYAAALGVIPAICGAGDVIIMDKLCHACLVDGARLSGAELRIFPHNNTAKLASHLAWARRERPNANVLVLAESVYSMDGDLAPLAEIVSLKADAGAWLLLDEAHGVGVLGEQGRGLADALGVAVEIQMGTLGKALGTHGAYVAGSKLLRDFLINRARSFIYSTAPPPPVAVAARKAVEIAAGPEGDARRVRLWGNIETFAALAGLSEPPQSAIVPIIVGDEVEAVSASGRLLEAGFLVPAIRYPTVSRGTARLRITFSADHTGDDIKSLAAALKDCGIRA